MSVRKILTVPGALPKWATSSNTTLEPSNPLQAQGWDLGDKPPARIMNWLQNLYYKWIQCFFRMQVSKWKLLNYTTPLGSCMGVVFHPNQGTWLMTDNNRHTWVSQTGINWDDEGALATSSALYGWKMDITNSYILVGCDEGIWTRTSAGTWALVTIATIGTSNLIKGVCSQFPVSEVTVAVDSAFEVYISAAITGSWGPATTQPPSPPSGTVTCARVVFAGGSNLYLLAAISGTTKIYKSLDYGISWSATASAPNFGTGEALEMGYDPDNDILVVVGEYNVRIGKIYYSLDKGDTWIASNIDWNSSTVPEVTLRAIYNCGNGVWVAGGYGPYSTALDRCTNSRILVTSDLDNWTWVPIDADAAVAGSGFRVRDFASNGKHLVAASSAGACICKHNGAAE